MKAKLHICSDSDLQSCVSGEKADVSKGEGIPSSSELVILSIKLIITNQVTIYVALSTCLESHIAYFYLDKTVHPAKNLLQLVLLLFA